MTHLEDLQPNAAVRGILPDQLLQWSASSGSARKLWS